MLGWLQLVKFGLPILIIIAAYGFGSTAVTEYRDSIRRVKDLERQLSLVESRSKACSNRIDIRDQAIANSKCAKQIQQWVRDPSKLPSPIPKPFSIPGQ